MKLKNRDLQLLIDYIDNKTDDKINYSETAIKIINRIDDKLEENRACAKFAPRREEDL
jgi:hypothetical protein